eukprot:6835982-Pyramimonas_sp.AAC.1
MRPALRREPHIGNDTSSIGQACGQCSSIRVIRGGEVSGETPSPPYRPAPGCDREELSIRKKNGGGGRGGGAEGGGGGGGWRGGAQ